MRKFATAIIILAAMAYLIVPGQASALNSSKIGQSWTGTVTLDYTTDQGESGSEHLNAAATIDASTDIRGTVSSSPPDPEIDGGYSWGLFGPVSGTYSGSISCMQSGTAGARFERPPQQSSGSYEFDQAFQIYGPQSPVADSQYVLDDMSLHLTGTEDCGEGSQAWDREHAPFPARSTLQYFGVNVNLRLPTSGPGGPAPASGGGFHWQGTKSYTGNSDFASYSAIWTYNLVYRPDSSKCSLKAANPQKPKVALVVKVVGGSTGCDAKLKAAKLKIGKKVYAFIKKHPEKKVSANKTWTVEIPLKGEALKTVQKGLKKGLNVKAKAEFKLDDETDSVVVKIK